MCRGAGRRPPLGWSYGHWGVVKTGLIWGRPRPIRTDEWVVVRLLMHAAVCNDFPRINYASYCNEDVRVNYGLPLCDWG